MLSVMMRCHVAKTLSLVGIIGCVALAASCGQPAARHGWFWKRVSVNSHALFQGGEPDVIWYNGCTRKVELYELNTVPSSLHYPPNFENQTMWSWNGSRWKAVRLSIELNPPADGQFAWNSVGCTALYVDLDAQSHGGVPVRSRPGQTFMPTWSWNGKSWSIVSVTSPDMLGDIPMVYDPATRTTLLYGYILHPPREVGEWPVPKGNSDQVISQLARIESSLAHDGFPRPTIDATASTWTFNGHSWAEGHTGNGTPKLASWPSVTYDPSTRSVVVFGATYHPRGYRISHRGKVSYQTWLWNGSWKMARPYTVPHVDTGFVAMAYDPLLKGVVLYDTQSHAIWLWTGTNWERLRTVNSAYPRTRMKPLMVFDNATGQLVLAGGSGFSYTYRGSTWALARR